MSNITEGIDQSQFSEKYRGTWKPDYPSEMPPHILDVGWDFMSQNPEIEIKELRIVGDPSSGFVQPKWETATFESKKLFNHLLPGDDLFTNPDTIHPAQVYGHIRKRRFWKLLGGPDSNPDRIIRETTQQVTHSTSKTTSMQRKISATVGGAFKGITGSVSAEVTQSESYTEGFSEQVTERVEHQREQGLIVTWYALVERYEIKLDEMNSDTLRDTALSIHHSNPGMKTKALNWANKNKNIIVFQNTTELYDFEEKFEARQEWSNTPDHSEEENEYIAWDIAGSEDEWLPGLLMSNRKEVRSYGFYSIDGIFFYDVWKEVARYDEALNKEYIDKFKPSAIS